MLPSVMASFNFLVRPRRYPPATPRAILLVADIGLPRRSGGGLVTVRNLSWSRQVRWFSTCAAAVLVRGKRDPIGWGKDGLATPTQRDDRTQGDDHEQRPERQSRPTLREGK